MSDIAAPEIRVVASGLRFPEGPVARPDGSLLVVEIAGGTLTRITPDGTVARIAHLGGGPNGAAIGDGVVYVANNGAAVSFRERDGSVRPGYSDGRPGGSGGSIQPVDLASGAVDTLYATWRPPRRGDRSFRKRAAERPHRAVQHRWP